MKKIKYLLIAIIIFLFITILSYKIISFKKDTNYLSNNSLAIMVETEEGEYTKYTSNKWPIDNYYFSKSECDNNSKVKWNYETNSVVLTSNKSDNCTLYFDKKQKDFAFTGGIQEFVIPVTGTYKLEVWGAQGGTILIKNTKDGGLGGYSSGEVFLSKGEILYVVVGGQGSSVNENDIYKGGYNGGGDGKNLNNQYGLGGGGATHIAKMSGVLSSLENYQSEILIVAGGGGGNGTATNTDYSPDGGAGGGITGITGINSRYYGYGGSQTSSGTCAFEGVLPCGGFGQGGSAINQTIGGAGGGGGFYGGSQSSRGHAGGGGGSGYIGNPILINGKTIAGNESFPSPSGGTETGHSGNGFARITLLSES